MGGGREGRRKGGREGGREEKRGRREKENDDMFCYKWQSIRTTQLSGYLWCTITQ